MKKILITGIHGSCASYLTEFLLEMTNLEVHGMARWHTDRAMNLGDPQQQQVIIHDCDLMDLGSVIRALGAAQPDYIFHLAANANVRSSFANPSSIFANNTIGTLNLLEGLRITGLKSILHFCGTSEVYGQVRPEDVPIKETHRLDPVNVYAISKLAQEKLCRSYWLSYGIPVIITRAFTYINPRRPDIFSSAFARQIVEIERGRRDKLVHGNLDSTRTMVDIRDMVAAYWLAAQKCRHGEAYNVGGIQPITVGEFLQELKKHAQVEIRSEVDPHLMRPTDVTMQIPDVTRFISQTSWRQRYSFTDSVAYLLQHFRSKP